MKEVRFCDFTLNMLGKTLWYRTHRVNLTRQEASLLVLLVGSFTRVVPREEITSALWPNEEISDSAISQAVCRLRRKLAFYNPHGEYIDTISGVGFKFIAPTEESKAPMASPFSSSAFHYYRRGAFTLEQRTERDVEASMVLFRRALEADRDYVPALVGLAQAYIAAAESGRMEVQKATSEAKALVATALEHDASCGEAHAVLSNAFLSFDRDILAASIAAENAVALSPSSPNALEAMVRVTIACGESGQIPMQLEAALLATPYSARLTTLLGMALYYDRRYAEAHQHLSDALKFAPRYLPACYFDACSLAMLGAFDSAESIIARLAPSATSPAFSALRAHIAGRRGDRDRFERAFALLSKSTPRSHVSKAIALSGASRFEEAASAVRLAFTSAEPNLIFLQAEPLASDLPSACGVAKLFEDISKPATRSHKTSWRTVKSGFTPASRNIPRHL